MHAVHMQCAHGARTWPSTSPQTVAPQSSRILVHGTNHSVAITGQPSNYGGSLPMPATSGMGHATLPQQRKLSESLWGTALRCRVVKPKVSDCKLWTHCRYKPHI